MEQNPPEHTKIRLRLLPATMTITMLALGMKLGDVLRDGRALSDAWISGVVAEESQPAPEAPKKEEVAAADSKDKEAAKEEKLTEGAEAKKEETGKHKDAKDGSADAGKDAKPTEPAAPAPEDLSKKKEFSPTEVDILQSLSKRRQELDEWGKEVELKETMLNATEQRINQKIDEMKKLKDDVNALLAQYNEKEDTKIRSLVKIYENMKPKDAARIFEELDMPILLEVVDKMSERKVAPVLANMTPQKAMAVTTEMAEQRRLHKPLPDSVSAN